MLPCGQLLSTQGRPVGSCKAVGHTLCHPPKECNALYIYTDWTTLAQVTDKSIPFMPRTEVIDVRSGAHLGHVFNGTPHIWLQPEGICRLSAGQAYMHIVLCCGAWACCMLTYSLRHGSVCLPLLRIHVCVLLCRRPEANRQALLHECGGLEVHSKGRGTS